MTAKVLMVQGTSSDVGKSLMVAALCRIYSRKGLRVAPFKSQNMALNSAVTSTGHEIGRAQAVQAEAAGVAPTVLMNPILLKPQSETGCQVVLMGKVMSQMSAADYHAHKPALRGAIADALARLREDFDLVIIEGAGSPVEMNLKDHDVANMFVAELCDAPVLLVADIDRGGVFASLVGTMALLEGTERDRVRGFLINKFRGDPKLLGNGLDIIREKTGVRVLGVVPYLRNLAIADEDSVALSNRSLRFDVARANAVRVAIVRLPHISNYDDFLPLERESALDVAYVQDAESIDAAHLVIVPGSKCTAEDMMWLHEQGLAMALRTRAASGKSILGICGGCQMLGSQLLDPEGVEAKRPRVEALGLLPYSTVYEPEKTTRQVEAYAHKNALWEVSEAIRGYEIHMGQIQWKTAPAPAFRIQLRNGAVGTFEDGGVSESGKIVGTMIHGIFENTGLRDSLLIGLGARADGDSFGSNSPSDAEFDRLADTVASHLDMAELDRIIGFAEDSH